MRIFLLTFFCSIVTYLSAQVTGPEQDCANAIPVCQTLYFQNQSYAGPGSIEEIPSQTICLTNGENNSVWYIFTVTTGGRLEMLITPNDPNDDYDFAIYNITGGSCSDIIAGQGNLVRCNYAFSSIITGSPTTGLLSGYWNTVANAGDSAFLRPLDVVAGETYVLIVDNFSQSSFGYTLDFNPGGASTASIIDQTPPVMLSVDSLTCDNTTAVDVTFSEPILCSSLAADGSDFTVTGPSGVTISSALSLDCITGSFTSLAVITLANPITVGGTYSLNLQTGTDGGTVEDNCGNQAIPASMQFFVPEIVHADYSYTVSSSCVADTFSFSSNSTGAILNLMWDFGDNSTSSSATPSHIFAVVDTYAVQLSVASTNCADTFSSAVIATNSFISDFTANPAVPCVGELITFTDISSAAATNYIWDFGDTGIGSGTTVTHFYGTAGDFLVTFSISDPAQSCSDTVQKVITVKENSMADFISDDPACFGSSINFEDNSAGAPASWEWDFGAGNIFTGSNVSFTFDSVGVYPVQLSVQDSFCGADTVIKNVSVLPTPEFSLQDTSICLSESVILTGFPGADSTIWSTGERRSSIEVTDVPQTVWGISYLDGCPAGDTVLIDERTVDCSFAKVPSGFTPNGDGSNDYLNVLPKRVKEFEIIIYNRWGNEVFRNSNENVGWDGTYKGEPADIGVYTYLMHWRALSGERHTQKGNITLIR